MHLDVNHVNQWHRWGTTLRLLLMASLRHYVEDTTHGIVEALSWGYYLWHRWGTTLRLLLMAFLGHYVEVTTHPVLIRVWYHMSRSKHADLIWPPCHTSQMTNVSLNWLQSYMLWMNHKCLADLTAIIHAMDEWRRDSLMALTHPRTETEKLPNRRYIARINLHGQLPGTL